MNRYRRTGDADQDLESLERVHHQVLESVSEGVIELAPDGRILSVNPAATRLLGYERSEIVGRLEHEVLHHTRPGGEPFPEGDCPILSGLAHGFTQKASDSAFWRKDRTTIPVEDVLSPLVQLGRTVGGVLVFRDLTSELELKSTRTEA